MNSLIFRTIAPVIFSVMLVFSVFVLLRGHNEPGGGFIGGLIAASGIFLYAMAVGVQVVRQALRIDVLALAGFGVFIAGLAGLFSLFVGAPFLTGLWTSIEIGGAKVALSTPMLFDIGVYFAVFGTISALGLALQDEGRAD